MDTDPISIAARTLLTERIGSVAQLEVLLLLLGGASDRRDASSVAAALRIDPRWAEQILLELAANKLASASTAESGITTYRLPANDPDLRAAVSELAAAYATHRVSVISLIFTKPPTPPAAPSQIHSFAEAFRLRGQTSPAPSQPAQTGPAPPPSTPLSRPPASPALRPPPPPQEPLHG